MRETFAQIQLQSGGLRCAPLGEDEARADSVTRDNPSQCNATMRSAFALLAFAF